MFTNYYCVLLYACCFDNINAYYCNNSIIFVKTLIRIIIMIFIFVMEHQLYNLLVIILIYNVSGCNTMQLKVYIKHNTQT